MSVRQTPSVVAGMATMPSRAATFELVLPAILPQVDRIYIYFDGHSEIPAAARGDPRVVSILSRDLPGLRGNGKMLGLWLEPAGCLYIGVDDDIAYPPNYVASLRSGFEQQGGRAAVGYHGSILARPLVRYNQGRMLIGFAAKLNAPHVVDVLGTGTAMFWSQSLRFDVRTWRHVNMVDLSFAMEAARARLQLVSLQRAQRFLQPLAEGQPDSIARALERDDTRQTVLARALLAYKASMKDSDAPPGSTDVEAAWLYAGRD